jgi:Tfp pilus assembly protein PilV
MSNLEVSLLRASGYGRERGQPLARHSRFGGGAKSACQAVAHGTPKRFRVGGLAKAGGRWSHQRGRSRGFTLGEMLISVVLLAFVVLFVSRLVNNAATITTVGNKRMDADSQGRQLLDRMAVDFDQMLKRTDISYYIKAGSTGTAMTGNDRMAFFSAIPGHLASTQSGWQSNIALVAYRVNADATSSSYNKVERMGKGLNLNGAYSGAITPLVFLDNAASPTTTITSIWPAATSATTPDPQSDYEVIGPQVFRLEYYFLLTPDPATGLPRGFSTGSQWTNTNTFLVKDVAAIVVAIAAIDPRSRAMLTTSNMEKLAGTNGQTSPLVDYTAGMVPGQLLSTWQTALDGTTGIPRAAISSVRLYERYFYLNQ